MQVCQSGKQGRYVKQQAIAWKEGSTYKTIGKAGTVEVRDCKIQGHCTVAATRGQELFLPDPGGHQGNHHQAR